MADLPDGYFNLKHRLVGATVLIVVAVTLLPRVLTGTNVETARFSDDGRTAPQIQPQVLSVVTTSESSLAGASGKTRIEIIEQPAVVRTDVESGSLQPRDSLKGDGTGNRSTEISLSSSSTTSESIVTGFIVQVGIFQRPDNARNLISKLNEDGIDPKVEAVEIDGQQATLIWLGPFSTRVEAEREGSKAMMRSETKPIIKEWP
jgi:cell division septation protein DedD